MRGIAQTIELVKGQEIRWVKVDEWTGTRNQKVVVTNLARCVATVREGGVRSDILNLALEAKYVDWLEFLEDEQINPGFEERDYKQYRAHTAWVEVPSESPLLRNYECFTVLLLLEGEWTAQVATWKDV